MNRDKKEDTIFDSGRFFQVEKKEEGLVTESLAMQEVVCWAEEVAREDTPCLLIGERGTGRELIAKKIHTHSSRKYSAFVSIDCSRYPQEKLEEEIFGREEDFLKGIPGYMGLVELCSGGSLFLHNIEYIGPHIQSRLDSFIQEDICLRVGGTTPLSPDTRILASSGTNIKQKVRDNHFQEKLFYAIKRRSIVLPCLQDRAGDIELLARHFLNFGEKSKTLSDCAINALRQYPWPGNVRELCHIMETVRALCPKDVIIKKDLPLVVLNNGRETPEQKDFSFQKISLEKLERLHIFAALENFEGNRTRTAKFLGITPKTLYNKLQSYGYYDKKCS